MSDPGEWEALIDDALAIREPPEDKRRRLTQLIRSILEDGLELADTDRLLRRLPDLDNNSDNGMP